MPLRDLRLEIESTPVPGDVRSFLREAERRIECFQKDCRVPAFVASDFARAYPVLRSLAAGPLAPGNLFCEWGSGFGVVTCLAALLDFDACGIEIDNGLVDAARQLASDFDLPARFVSGSFIPPGAETRLGNDAECFTWLTTTADTAYEELGLAPDDFDVIFAYPWPDEENATERLFEHYARRGAVLLTYHEDTRFRLRRKVERISIRSSRRRKRNGD